MKLAHPCEGDHGRCLRCRQGLLDILQGTQTSAAIFGVILNSSSQESGRVAAAEGVVVSTAGYDVYVCVVKKHQRAKTTKQSSVRRLGRAGCHCTFQPSNSRGWGEEGERSTILEFGIPKTNDRCGYLPTP